MLDIYKSENGLSATGKTTMIIGSTHSRNLINKVCDYSVMLNNKPIPRTSCFECLGVSLDERMSWEKHIENMTTKVWAGNSSNETK